jgi:undecaprenyl-diphosphatase
MTIDVELFLTINRALASPLATFFFSTVTYLGNGLLLAVLILPPLYYFDRTAFRRHTLPLVAAVALSGAVVNLMKVAVDRPRPTVYFQDSNIEIHTPLGTPPDRAFPSGHTQTAFGAATYLSCLYPAASPLFLALAALVGLSRIAVGVHFPLDVLVGALFGTAFSLVAYLWVKKRHRKPPDVQPPQ